MMVTQDEFNCNMQSMVDTKAIKHDNAAVPVHIWNDRLIANYPAPDRIKGISKEAIEHSLDIMRKHLTTKCCRIVSKSLISYLKFTWPEEWRKYQEKKERRKEEVNSEFIEDVIAGRECLWYTSQCSWWEWSGGSCLLFWRWSEDCRTWARDGIPVCWMDKLKLNDDKEVE
jgi:hypothetical protein